MLNMQLLDFHSQINVPSNELIYFTLSECSSLHMRHFIDWRSFHDVDLADYQAGVVAELPGSRTAACVKIADLPNDRMLVMYIHKPAYSLDATVEQDRVAIVTAINESIIYREINGEVIVDDIGDITHKSSVEIVKEKGPWFLALVAGTLLGATINE